jgi:hypothetical protein
LLLSPIGASPGNDDACLANFGHTTLLREGGQHRGLDLSEFGPDKPSAPPKTVS